MKEKEKLAQSSTAEDDPDAARKGRLQQKLESFQIAEEAASGDQAADSASQKQLDATAEEMVTGKTAESKASPPAEASIQTMKEVHVNNHMLEEVNKGQQFSSLVEQVEREQQVKAAKARTEQALREQREKQQSLQD